MKNTNYSISTVQPGNVYGELTVLEEDFEREEYNRIANKGE